MTDDDLYQSFIDLIQEGIASPGTFTMIEIDRLSILAEAVESKLSNRIKELVKHVASRADYHLDNRVELKLLLSRILAQIELSLIIPHSRSKDATSTDQLLNSELHPTFDLNEMDTQGTSEKPPTFSVIW